MSIARSPSMMISRAYAQKCTILKRPGFECFDEENLLIIKRLACGKEEPLKWIKDSSVRLKRVGRLTINQDLPFEFRSALVVRQAVQKRLHRRALVPVDQLFMRVHDMIIDRFPKNDVRCI